MEQGFLKGNTMLIKQGVVLPAVAVLMVAAACFWTGDASAESKHVAAEGSMPGRGLTGVSPLEEVSIDLAFAWDSAYMAEGRDSLDGKGLVGTTLDAGYGGFNLGSWFASSPGTEYTEWNIYADYTVEHEGWHASVGCNHLEFLTDDADDNEVGAALGYTEFPAGLGAHLDWYHSFEAEGSFFEAAVDGEYDVGNHVKLVPAASMGFNAGYVVEGHRGANNIAVSLAGSIPLKDGVELGAYVAHTWAINRDPAAHPDDELLKDFFFGGLSLGVSL
jgi:hypothetical protein